VSALELYLPLAQFGFFLTGWITSMVTGLLFIKAGDH